MKAIAALAVLLLVGCRQETHSQADGRIVWDRDGCAYYVKEHIGDTSFVRRMPDGDNGRCAEAKDGQ